VVAQVLVRQVACAAHKHLLRELRRAQVRLGHGRLGVQPPPLDLVLARLRAWRGCDAGLVAVAARRTTPLAAPPGPL
jgi:hypothetical protein